VVLMDGMDGEMEAFGVKEVSRAFVDFWHSIVIYQTLVMCKLALGNEDILLI